MAEKSRVVPVLGSVIVLTERIEGRSCRCNYSTVWEPENIENLNFSFLHDQYSILALGILPANSRYIIETARDALRRKNIDAPFYADMNSHARQSYNNIKSNILKAEQNRLSLNKNEQDQASQYILAIRTRDDFSTIDVLLPIVSDKTIDLVHFNVPEAQKIYTRHSKKSYDQDSLSADVSAINKELDKAYREYLMKHPELLMKF